MVDSKKLDDDELIQNHSRNVFCAFLSFIMPGLGHFIKKKVMKGIILLLLNIILIVGFFVLAIFTKNFVFVLIDFIIFIMIWIYSVVDAYRI
jgi:hypothetical protein